ncbi:MAG: hypothetical protein GY775_19565 [Candidatus Scalindua sp.]|nr:hypothetical protein [Candidatus Scalindua sp.]
MVQTKWFKHAQIKLSFLILLVSLFLSFSSFAEDAELEIEKATYKAGDGKLIVKVKRENKNRTTIRVIDNITNQLLAEKQSSDDEIKFKIKDITGEQVPCSVRVEVGSLSVSRQVKNAPSNCSQNANDSGSDPGQNTAPSCSITLPNENPVVISLGDKVFFSGAASDPDNDPLSFEWDFAGGADIRPLVAEPGEIMFTQNDSSFLVTFIVTDSHGARCTDTMTVEVGNIPIDLTPKVSEAPAPGTLAAGDQQHVVLPYNDLGMHCGDLNSYPFSILPPFNTINGQLIRKGSIGASKPVLLNNVIYQLQYSAASNPKDPIGPGSINSTSQNYPPGTKFADAIIKKGDFWDQIDTEDTVVSALFGVNLLPDTGLFGETMPGISNPYYANDPKKFSFYDNEKQWFTALGVPMIGIDDRGRRNSYSLMRIQGKDKFSGEIMATTDVVVPVSSEVDCRDCHTKGKIGADTNARSIPNAPQFYHPASLDIADVEQAAKKNIISLHNFKHGTQLLENGKPVLCAGCHASNALGTLGEADTNMSNAMHGHHGRLQVDNNGKLLRDSNDEPVLINPNNLSGQEKLLIAFGPDIPMQENCFLCHPGKITQCFRGAMYTAGQQCEDCHGNMLAVGGEYPLKDGRIRVPWVDEPRCESCHTGHGDEAVLTKAFDDLAATPLKAARPRFAENPGTLYRNSIGHGGVGCEGCHGSPHAIWPNRNPDANDNVTAIQLQGHKGSIRECTVCHKVNSFPNGTMDGPHGMHPVNDPIWIKSKDDMYHEDYVKDAQGNDQCAACHGVDHRGTRLSKVPVDRVLKDAEGKVRATLSAGDIVSCDLCHDLEKSFDN